MKKLLCLALLVSAGSIYSESISANNKPTDNKSGNNSKDIYKKTWIDFNAGILAQGADMQETTEVFFKKLLAIASGERTQSETHDYREIAIFKDGVTL